MTYLTIPISLFKSILYNDLKVPIDTKDTFSPFLMKVKLVPIKLLNDYTITVMPIYSLTRYCFAAKILQQISGLLAD